LPHQGAAEPPNHDDAYDRAASLHRETHAPGAQSAAEPDQRNRLRELLARALPDAATETIETLVETARLRAVRSGDAIIRQGETLPFTLVIHGYAAIRRTTTDARELVLGIARRARSSVTGESPVA